MFAFLKYAMLVPLGIYVQIVIFFCWKLGASYLRISYLDEPFLLIHIQFLNIFKVVENRSLYWPSLAANLFVCLVEHWLNLIKLQLPSCPAAIKSSPSAMFIVARVSVSWVCTRVAQCLPPTRSKLRKCCKQRVKLLFPKHWKFYFEQNYSL